MVVIVYSAVAVGSSLSALAVGYYLLISKRKKAWQAPFADDSRRPREPRDVLTDRDKRTAVIKRKFTEADIPSSVDAIVIGSGIGGLSVAAILAKTGRRVLVLEQHGKAGGWCHTFKKDGAEWDVGIHYVGKMGSDGELNRFIIDQLTEGRLDWHEMAEDFDHAGVEDPETKKLVMVPLRKDRAKLVESLVERFPANEAGIREYFRMAEDAETVTEYLVILKLVPKWLAWVIRWLVPGARKFFYYFHELNALSVLERVAPGNKALQVALSCLWPDCGSPPRRTSFGQIAVLLNHFMRGAYYPIGGASEIAYSLIPTIEKTGGRVLMKARVKEILFSENQRSAVGVRVEFGKGKLVDIKAPLVVSDAGVSNTFLRLLPPQVSERTSLGRLVTSGRLKPSCTMFQVFAGLAGSQGELELPSRNFWVTYGNTPDDLDRWTGLSFDEAIKERVPLFFLAFPSAKDPTYGERLPDRSACVAIAIVSPDWFKAWADQPKGKRGEDYQAAKMLLAEQIWDQVVELFPAISGRRRYLDAGSPVTAEHYLNAIVGESYGLDHGQDRFSPEIVTTLRPPVAEIKNLYLSGQDMCVCSFTGAMMGGLACAHSILSASGETFNLFADLERLYKRCAKREK